MATLWTQKEHFDSKIFFCDFLVYISLRGRGDTRAGEKKNPT